MLLADIISRKESGSNNLNLAEMVVDPFADPETSIKSETVAVAVLWPAETPDIPVNDDAVADAVEDPCADPDTSLVNETSATAKAAPADVPDIET